MPEEARPKPGRREDAGGPEPEAASAILEDLQSLQKRLEAAEEERDSYLSLLQRTRADFENYQKRVQRDREEERRYAHAALTRELLPVLDNLERALEAARREGEKGPLTQGVVLVESQLMGILRRFGIAPLEAQGRPFDPLLHEAVLQEARFDVAPGTVVRVLEPGYRLHERILRPARVVVAAPPTPLEE